MQFIDLVSRITITGDKYLNVEYAKCLISYNLQFRDNDRLIAIIKIFAGV